jgi:putative ABC transport system ATP-binding protein
MENLRLNEVSFTTEEKTIIEKINLKIEQGDCISVVGESGSGKSTLLKLLADLISPTEGSIFYKNKDYTAYDPLVLRKKVSYCVQMPYLFGNTVKENLLFPFHIRKETIDYTKIHSFLGDFKLPKDILEKNPHTLSGGEKQRISLIRSLLYTPEVLLLDEVTAALDQENTKIVEAYIKRLNTEGVTILWITHSEEQSKNIFHKRIRLAGGRLMEVEVIR